MWYLNVHVNTASMDWNSAGDIVFVVMILSFLGVCKLDLLTSRGYCEFETTPERVPEIHFSTLISGWGVIRISWQFHL